jgi:hypothetical protein
VVQVLRLGGVIHFMAETLSMKRDQHDDPDADTGGRDVFRTRPLGSRDRAGRRYGADS